MKKIVSLSLLLLAGIGAGYWYATSPDTSGDVVLGGSGEVSPEGGTSATLESDRSRADGMDSRRADRREELRELPPFVVLANIKHASEGFRELLPRAERGDFSALVAVSSLIGDCSVIFSDQRLAPTNKFPAGTANHQAWQAALTRRKDFCDDPNSHKMAAEQLLADFPKKMEEASAQGDEVAIASNLFLDRDEEDPVGVEVALGIAQTTEEPEALRDAVLALAGSSDRRVKAIESRVFNDLQTQSERDAVIARAAEWMACESGAPGCAAYSRESDSDCLYLGECYSHLSRPDYIRTRALSAQQYEQMRQYVDLLKRELLNRK